MSERTTWIELEDTFLVDVPTIVRGRGKNRTEGPDPTVEPKNYYLFAYTCKRTKTGKPAKSPRKAPRQDSPRRGKQNQPRSGRSKKGGR